MLDLSNLKYKVQDSNIDVFKAYPQLETDFLKDISGKAGQDILRYIIVRYDQEIWITQLPDEDPEQASMEVCRTLGINWEDIKEHCSGKKFAAAVNDYIILTQSSNWAQLVAFEVNRTQVFLDSYNPDLSPSERKTTLQSIRDIDDMTARMKGVMKAMFRDEEDLVEGAKARMVREIKGFVMSNIANMEAE